MLAFIVAAQHGDSFDGVEGVQAIDDAPVAKPAVVGEGIVDGDYLAGVELCLSFVVQHLDDVSELLAVGGDPRHGCDDRREGLRGGKGEDEAELCLVISSGFF